jgi:DNA phosphorothioation-dependent restriction protein DptH
LFGDTNFTKNIYRTFFTSQFLTNAEKLNANNLLSDEEYNKIGKYRYELLNLQYSLQEKLPIKEMGNAAIISFFSHAPHSLSTSLVDNVPVCEVHFSEKECFQFVAEPYSKHLDFLVTDLIRVDNDTKNVIDNSITTITQNVDEPVIELTDIIDEVDEITTDQIIETNQLKSKMDQPNVEIPTEDDVKNLDLHKIKITVGHTQSGHREVVFEPNNTKMVSHPNMGIIGTMGTGKTQFARSVIAQFSKESVHNVGGKPVGMLVFDYKGDYKDKEFLDAVGGSCYKFNYPFNPLKLVVNDEVVGMNLPAITADRIADSFAKAYGLGLKQQSNIKQVIIDTYKDAGITKDPSTWDNLVPTMEQVIEKYFEMYDANDKAFALFDKLRDYTIFTTDNSNCVSLFEWLNSVRVIDLTLYPDDTKKVIVSLILDLFYAEMRQLGGSKQKDGFRELRAMIMVDEAHQFLKKDFNSFRSIISEGRMFGVGMILSTQNVSDFKTSKEDYSQFILSWVIHHVNSISKAEIANIFGASDSNGERYMDFINKAKLFESVCKIGARVEGIRDLPFFELIQADKRFFESNNI